MTDEEIILRLTSGVEGLNEILKKAQAAGFRVRLASCVEKNYDHTDHLVLQDITKSFFPASVARTPTDGGGDNG